MAIELTYFEVTPEDGLVPIVACIQPEDFIADMVRTGQITPTGEYHHDVHRMCKIACTWIMSRFSMRGFKDDMTIVKGEYCGDEHYWVEVSGVILDLTLAQFNSDAPQLAIVDMDYIDENDSLVGLTYDPIAKYSYGEALAKTYGMGL